ncbi:unnamed protein product [Clavelina lepadiformis]|uniref:Uncharacterized protein n=1 Tax=Clavelina lepadiformis TaxID=159417 RepID=A0ABP0G2Y6_CLALP
MEEEPTLCMPKLTLAQVHSRKPPKKRIFETKVHFKSVVSLKSARLPEGWQRICYCGWKAPRSSCIYSLDITTQTLHGTIKDIESFSICSGLDNSGSGLPHMTTRSMTPFSSENVPTVRKLAYRIKLGNRGLRSENCRGEFEDFSLVQEQRYFKDSDGKAASIDQSH